MDHVSTHQAEEDARNEAIQIYVNGRILPKAQAVVSVYDAGFMLGDGVWEGIRLYNGRWAFLDDHLYRLFEAALAIDLDIGMTKDQVKSALSDTQSANGDNRPMRPLDNRPPDPDPPATVAALDTSKILERVAFNSNHTLRR